MGGILIKKNLTPFLALDCWQSTSPFPSASHMGKLIRKFRLSCLWYQQEIQTTQTLPVCRTPYSSSSPNHNKNWASLLSLLSQAMFGPAWESTQLSSERLVMWAINLSISSRCVGDVISLDIQTKSWIRDPYHLYRVTTVDVEKDTWSK